MPTDFAAAPRALVPSKSVKLDRQAEDEMVTFVMSRLDTHRNQMGWTNDGGYTKDSWAYKRHIATRMFEGDFSHRAVPGTLFGRINLTLNMAAQFIEQHKSRITGDLLSSEHFFGVGPEGSEDANPVLKDVEHVMHDAASRLGLQDKLKLAVGNALIRGEAVPKMTRVVRREQVTKCERVLIFTGDGSPQLDSRGGFIVESDKWVPVPDNAARKMLARDNDIQLPIDAGLYYSQQPFHLPVTVSMHSGCDFEFPHWSDLVIPVTAVSLDASELLAHCFMRAVPDLMDTLPPDAALTPQGIEYLKEVRGTGTTGEANITEQARAQAHRGESVDRTDADDERGYRERRYDEIYFRYDWRKNGRYEHLVILIDRDAQWPIYYGQAAEIMPWTTKHHPFREPIRICPYEDRWYGRGYYERYGDAALFVDKCWCRMEAELQKSGNILIYNRQATEQGRAGKPITFRTTECLEMSGGNSDPEQVLHVVKVQAMTAEIENSMDTMLQKMQSDTGVTGPGDPQSDPMNLSKTLGEAQLADQNKSVVMREREGELLPGINSSLVGIAEIEFFQPDLMALTKLLEKKQTSAAPLPQISAAPKPGASGPAPGLPAPAVGDGAQGSAAAPPAAGQPPPVPLPPPPPPPDMRAEILIQWAKENSGELSKVIKLYVTRSRQAQLFDNSSRVIQVIDKWLMYPPEVRPNLWDTFCNMLRALEVQNPEQLLGPKNPPMPMPAPPVAGASGPGQPPAAPTPPGAA